MIIFFLAKDEDTVILDEFFGSQRSSRRRAICCEIKKTMNTFKVNGARMSLCHMRQELGGHNEFGTSEDEIEGVCKPSGKC